MSTPTKVRAVSALSVLAVLVTIVVAVGTFGRPQDGTALWQPDNRAAMTWGMEVGERYTDVWTSVRVQEGRTVTLRSAEFLGDFAGVRRIGEPMVADDGLQADVLTGYPPDGDRFSRKTWATAVNLRPLEGATLTYRGEPETSSVNVYYTLVFGIEIVKPGRWERTHVRVHYTENGRDYYQDIPLGFIICTPEGREADGECAPPAWY